MNFLRERWRGGRNWTWLSQLISHDASMGRISSWDSKAVVMVNGSRAISMLVTVFWISLTASTLGAQVPATINIDVDKPGAAISPTFFGLMTEEINHSYEGGLLAELVQNRTFQDPMLGTNEQPTAPDAMPIHWSVIGSGKISTDNNTPLNAALPLSLRLDLSGEMDGIANDGFWGIPIWPDTTYTASFYAKGGNGFSGIVTAALVMGNGDVTVAKADTKAVNDQWQKYTLTLKTGHDAPTTAEAKFVLFASGKGSVYFSLVSLFPPTYQNMPEGLRPDLMKLLADMHPSFIRLPGGNYLEGGRFSDRFNWKKMIGPVDERPGHMSCWGYRSGDAFGLPQYLLWCKQLNAEPVLAVFAGYCLNGDHFVAGNPELALYTEEALQEIEYVSGPPDSEWGRRRVADGFPRPFPLHYIEIGNEDWIDKSGSYDGRFTEMAKAIRSRYPNLKIIATGPVSSSKPDLFDDHYYASSRQMSEMFNLYNEPKVGAKTNDGGRRTDGTPIFVGEWASQEGKPTPDLNAALADAAFLMGLERNADVVKLESYAPLLVNVNPEDKAKGYPRGSQWDTNLIGFNALHSFGSPSYYVQAMFGQNKGDVVLPLKLDVAPMVTPTPSPHGSVGVGQWHTNVEYADLTVTSPDGKPLLTNDQSKDEKTWQFTGADWVLQDERIKSGCPEGQSWAIIGDSNWKDYTIHLRARKLGGDEGIIVLWHAADGDNYHWWNVGGWANTIARCEAAENGAREAYGPSAPFHVETARWYDVRLEITGNRMRGYIDDKLVTDATRESTPTSISTYASATYITADHILIVKAVNFGNDPVSAIINLRGARNIDPKGIAFILAGKPTAINTISQPTNIVPKSEAVTDASAMFMRTLPPHSLTVLRLNAF